MSTQAPSIDSVLAMFARDYLAEPSVLVTYLERYPHAGRDLVAYAHELELQAHFARDEELDSAVEAQIARLLDSETSPADPFAVLDPSGYQRLRQLLGVPSIVLTAFRDRLVAAGSVPLGFLDRMADGLGTSLTELADHLSAPPRQLRAVQHKADTAPSIGLAKTDFAVLLEEAGVRPERIAELIAE